MTITTFQMLCNEISLLVSQVMLYYRTKLRDFFDVHGQIYLVNVFPSPIIRINFFCTSQKPSQASVKPFLRIKGFFPLVSITSF